MSTTKTSQKIKGVVLAGGQGTRLQPLTKYTNKHLLPIYNKPMIYYPIDTLVKAGIEEIMIVSNEEYIDKFQDLLTNNSSPSSSPFPNCKFSFGTQKGAGGIAEALKVAQDFTSESKFAAILGDNIYEHNFKKDIQEFANSTEGARIFLHERDNVHGLGIAELDPDKNVVNIEEKPQQPKTNFAVTGIYFYDPQVYQAINSIQPSARGELEITDVNNWYIEREQMQARFISGEWVDAGTFENLYNASRIARSLKL